MIDFKKWFSTNLIIDRFPVKNEIQENGKHSDCKVIINVSEDFFLGNSEDIISQNKLNYWFPMGESSSNMGLHSIYGALSVLHSVYTFKPDWKVLLHCQAGANRSPTVKACFYYMMTNEHLPEIKSGKIFLQSNRLIDNCSKHLPSLDVMENWIKKCFVTFNEPEKFLGGQLDWTLEESGIDKYVS